MQPDWFLNKIPQEASLIKLRLRSFTDIIKLLLIVSSYGISGREKPCRWLAFNKRKATRFKVTVSFFVLAMKQRTAEREGCSCLSE